MNRYVSISIFLFVLYNLSSQFLFFNSLSNVFLVLSLLIGIFVVVNSLSLGLKKRDFTYATWVLYFCFGLLLYQFSIGIIDPKEEAIIYLISKIAITLLLIYYIAQCNLQSVWNFYLYVALVVFSLLIFGFLVDVQEVSGRRFLGFGNPNSAGFYSAFASIVFVCYLVEKYSNIRFYFFAIIASLIFFLCYLLLLSGSRSGILFFGLMSVFIFSRYISLKNFSFWCLMGILSVYLLNLYANELPGLERVLATFEGLEVANRETEIKGALEMINERPYSGWGLDSYRYVKGKALDHTDLGSHNGYLSFIKMVGIPFFVVFILPMIIVALFKSLSFIKNSNLFVRFNSGFVFSMLILAFFEDYIVGFNSLPSMIFFMSFLVLLSPFSGKEHGK